MVQKMAYIGRQYGFGAGSASCLALGVALAAIAMPGVSLAADAEPHGLEEIVVTAQKREENLQDIPVAVTALDAGKLESLRVNNFNDLSGIAPNVTASQSTSGSNPLVTIRGITGGNVEPGKDNGIAMYVDGVYIARSVGAAFDVADLERVEVLRGPQGTLYGRNSTGGAINYITAAPKGELYARQDVTVSNYSGLRTKTRIDLPTFADISISGTFVHDERDGWVRNTEAGRVWDFSTYSAGLNKGRHVSAKTLGARNVDAGLIAVRFAPQSLPLVIDYKFDRTIARYTNQPMQTVWDIATSAPPPRGLGLKRKLPATFVRQNALPAGFTTPEKLSAFGHNLTIALDVSDSVQIKSITGLRGYTDEYSTENIGGGLEGAVNPFYPFVNGVSYFLPLGIAAHEKDRTFSQEVQLNYRSERVDAIAGVYYFTQHTRSLHPTYAFQFIKNPQGALLPPALLTDADNHNRSIAGFAQVTFHATSQLDIAGGIRATKDKRRSETTQTVTPKFSESFSHVDWTANVSYRPTDTVTLYAKAGSGYLSGGIFNLRQFKPETLIQYEIGAKTEWLDRRMRLNVSAFRSDYKDLQQSATDPATLLYQTFNVGKARVTGIEVELTALPVDSVTLTANYGYTDFKYRSFVLPREGDVTNIAQSLFRPKHNLSLGAEVQLPEFGDGVKPSLSVSGRWRSNMDIGGVLPTSYFIGALGLPVEKFLRNNAMWMVDGRFNLADIPTGLGDGKMKVSAWVHNALNKRPIAQAVALGGVAVGGVFAEPRTYGLQLGVEF